MALSAEMLDAMIAAGLSREQMAALIKADLAKDEAAAAERRAKAAAKKRRQRAEVKLAPVDVPDCPGDIRGHQGTDRDSEGQAGTEQKNGPQTPKENNPSGDSPSDPKGSSAPKGADRRRGHRIPDDFAGSDEARAIAAEFGFAGAAADEPLAEFADYWRGVPGARGTKLDWPATLRNRLREVSRRRPQARASPARRGTGNGFFDALLDDHGAPDERSSGPRSDDHGNVHRLAASGRNAGR